VAIGIVTIVVNVALNLLLVRLYSFRGLALGTSVAALFNGAVLLVLLRHRLGGLDGARLARSFVRIVTAAIVMGAAAHWTLQMLEALVGGHTLAAQIVRLGGTIGFALFVLTGSAWLLRIREFNEAVRLVTERFRRP
jgi:putative peptidoglycan lipid II flippase